MGDVTKSGALASGVFGGGPSGPGGEVTAAAMAAALTATNIAGRADVRRTGRTTTYTTVLDEAGMLGLTYVNQGDRIWRTDTETIWTLRVAPAWGSPANVLGDWYNEGQPPGIDAEAVRDTVAAMISAGSHSGITITHDDAGNAMSFTVTGGAGGAGAALRAVTPLALERFYTAASLPPTGTNNVKLARVVIPRALLIPGVTIVLDGVVRGGGAADTFSGSVKLGPAGTAFSDAAMNIVGVISASAVGTTSSFGLRIGVDPDDPTKLTTLQTSTANPYSNAVTDSVTTSLTAGVHEVAIPGSGDMELAIGCNVGSTDRPYAGYCVALVVNPAAVEVTPVSREITGATTLGPADINTTHRFNSGSAAVITVPVDSTLGLTPGQATITVFIQGAGVPTFTASGSTILGSPPAGLAQNSTVVLSHTGASNTWSYA